MKFRSHYVGLSASEQRPATPVATFHNQLVQDRPSMKALFMSSTGTQAARSRSKFLVLMIKDKGRNVVRNRTQGD
jgi:hypothetical protein